MKCETFSMDGYTFCRVSGRLCGNMCPIANTVRQVTALKLVAQVLREPPYPDRFTLEIVNKIIMNKMKFINEMRGG